MSIKVLHINCHPLFSDDNHTTVKLAQHGLACLKDKQEIEIDILNLYDENLLLPKISNLLLGAWFKKDEKLSDEAVDILNRQNNLVKQWIEADYIFIYSPLHNFNVTSAFKDYVDNILIAGQTFKYTESGSVGLLSDSKKVIYVQSSGGAYQEELRYISADVAPHYVRTILSVMGINKMHLIRVEGMDIKGNNREQLIENGKSEITNYITRNFVA